tara:strand:+ start:1434 stop:2288 length:855 start_codon:yes stop_codon:yes gene_type:complete
MFSIIIPSFNNYDYLKLTIDSIIKTSTFDNEILVHVNNDSSKKTRNYLISKNIKYTFSKDNIGLCSSINTIAQKTSFDYLIYSHDDMYFCPGWEKPLLNEINSLSHSKFYFSGSMIEPNSGHIKFDCGIDLYNFDEKKLLNNYLNLNINDHQGSHFAPHCIHKKMWIKVKGFSEEFNPGIASDPDFNMKLWNEGVRVFKGLSRFKVYHFGSVTTRKNKDIIKNKGDITFLKKWGITSKFFKKHYLRSKTRYNGPLEEPKKNFKYFIDLIKCKIKLFFINLTNHK